MSVIARFVVCVPICKAARADLADQPVQDRDLRLDQRHPDKRPHKQVHKQVWRAVEHRLRAHRCKSLHRHLRPEQQNPLKRRPNVRQSVSRVNTLSLPKICAETARHCVCVPMRLARLTRRPLMMRPMPRSKHLQHSASVIDSCSTPTHLHPNLKK